MTEVIAINRPPPEPVAPDPAPNHNGPPPRDVHRLDAAPLVNTGPTFPVLAKGRRPGSWVTQSQTRRALLMRELRAVEADFRARGYGPLHSIRLVHEDKALDAFEKRYPKAAATLTHAEYDSLFDNFLGELLDAALAGTPQK